MHPIRAASWPTLLVCALSCGPATSPALAQAVLAQPAAPAGDGWQVNVTGFAWLASIGGHTTVRGNEAKASAKFTEIIDKVSTIPISLMSQIDIRKEDWGVFVSPIYMRLGFNPSNRLFNADVTTENLYLEWGGFYRVMHGSFKPDTDGWNWSVEVLGGARYTQLSVDASFERGFSEGGTHSWVDPFIGLRGRVGLGRDFELGWRGDIGGFNVGSTFSWNVQAQIGYKFALFGRPAIAFAGYKALSQDYTSGNGNERFRWNTVMYGPTLGLSVRF
jgi:hypothetical protein